MMKTFFKALAIIMGMVMSTALVACGNDDDEPNIPDTPKEVASYEIDYMAEVSQGYLDFYDVTISYVDSKGETVTEALTAKKSFSVNVPANLMPAEASLTVHATLKNPLSSYDVEGVYEFGVSYQLVVNRIYSDKSVELVGGNIIPNSHKLSVKGEKLNEYFTKYADVSIASNTVSVK